MTGQEIEAIYNRHLPEKSWWGEVPAAWNILKEGLPETADLYHLIPICARIALHITGELPRIGFSPDLSETGNFNAVLLHPRLLELNLPEVVRANVFFGHFIHQLGHIVYSRDAYQKLNCSRQQRQYLHLIEDRRIESKLTQAYPGYFQYLYAARNLGFTVALLRAEDNLRFTDLDHVRNHYLFTKVRYPELLESDVFRQRLGMHHTHLKWIDQWLGEIKDYGKLEAREVIELSKYLYTRLRLPHEPEESLFNYYSKGMANLPLEVEGTPVDIDVKVLDDLFQDLSKTLDLVPGEIPENREDGKGAKGSSETIGGGVWETEAVCGEVEASVLNEAKELAGKLRLNFLTYQARMNRQCIFYEQESGELDEDELYQASFNSQIFIEELPVPAANLEIIILLDLSGSMAEDNKLDLQKTLSLALCLAFQGNPHIRFSIYGHRVKQDSLEVVRYYEHGKKFDFKKLFSQEGRYVNADGYAIEYALGKFSSFRDHRLILVISDGMPTASPPRISPRLHVREMVRKAKRIGVDVLSIGISNFNQVDMYDEFIPYMNADIAERLVQWFRRKLEIIADGAVF